MKAREVRCTVCYNNCGEYIGFGLRIFEEGRRRRPDRRLRHNKEKTKHWCSPEDRQSSGDSHKEVRSRVLVISVCVFCVTAVLEEREERARGYVIRHILKVMVAIKRIRTSQSASRNPRLPAPSFFRKGRSY